MRNLNLAGVALALMLPMPVIAADYSPYANETYSRQVLWGDTHLHSSYSLDAGMLGNRLGPEVAYRFARGEVVETNLGEKARLVRPLDFIVLADHSENLGLAPMLAEANKDLLATGFGRQLFDHIRAGEPEKAFGMIVRAVAAGEDPLKDAPSLVETMWQRLIKYAEQYNEPGKFTALLGYEWTSLPQANNLHRVVVFRDNADRVSSILPYSSYESNDPEKLWDWMEDYEKKSGGRVLAIPHNGNLSNGLMFKTERADGRAFDAEYAARRSRLEPLVEVTQIKGDGETHPLLSPDDEFADYETWDKGNFGYETKKPEMLRYEYTRSALRLGLEQQGQLGENPFKLGLVGGTDSHTSLATAGEDNFFGKVSIVEPSNNPQRFYEKLMRPQAPNVSEDITVMHWKAAASGLAAVWAKENTRDSIFDALERREVYATTGSRITVRFFGGWNFQEEDVNHSDFLQRGYGKGVPMGGDLFPSANGVKPSFLVSALKDPDGANLDRIQIVKVWTDEANQSHEKVYDVALGGDKRKSWLGKVKPVGSTVDVPQASYANSIGAAQLNAYWIDPDFDAKQRALYYVRVIEIPTPRWTAYDAKHFGVVAPIEAEMTTQERAYTSPIWYQPKPD
ncbi:DUF3604 domain-containing protein [Zhongshania sp.]|uniref:DUF3604 domain-containing protein n=2 Tax=Zhongshania sp. TaxID=1971902 RepID=UPI003562BF31